MKNIEEGLKKSVVNHFQSDFPRILGNAALPTASIDITDIQLIGEVALTPSRKKDEYTFVAHFNIPKYIITYRGTINKNKTVTDESVAGKKC